MDTLPAREAGSGAAGAPVGVDTDGHAARQNARHSDRFRDQILHVEPSPDGQAFLGDLRGFSRVAASHYVQDVQAPSDYSVTPKEAARFWSKVNKTDGCWEWTAYTYAGYGRLTLRGRSMKAHRLSYEMAYGSIPDGLCVLHHCDNPPCVNPEHLYLGDHSDNADDRGARDRQPRGEKSATARLTEEDVRTIIALSAAGATRKEVAARYGIDPGHVNHIVRGRRWAHLSAVTSGHGECECSECSTGWSYRWSEWMAGR